MEKKNQSSKPEEVTVDYAYAVLNVLVESMDRVSAKPEISKAFLFSIQQKYPDILDAIMAITAPEHREIVGKAIKACARMTAVWLRVGKI